MRILLLSAAIVGCCLGCAFYSTRAADSTIGLFTNLADIQQSQASSSVKENIQRLSSSNPRERTEAACALGEARATTAIPALIKTLADDAPVDQPVCGQKGSWSKGENGEPNRTSPGEMAAVALSRIGRDSVDPLIGVLDTNSWQARANAAFALGLIRDERSIAPLIAATKDSDGHVREKAVWSLGLQGDSRAVEPLTIALSDPESPVRAQAAWALGLKGDARAVEPLIGALADVDASVQSQAAWALGLKGDSRAVEPLSIALRAAAENVRSQAAWALGLKGDSRAVEPLIAALKDSNAQVRSQAAWALGLKGDERAIAPLQVATSDPNAEVRKQAKWALQMRELQSGRSTELRSLDKDLKIYPKVKVKFR